MARKYLRGLSYTTSTNGRDTSIFMRLLYEFWGYCVNGTSSLTVPGGMPTTPTNGPANFFEGTSVLASGTDGSTSDLGVNFTSLSANFNISLIGKYVTIWSPGSSSTDDSIYQIISVPSSTQLVLSVFSGGTPDTTTLKNNLTSRSSLNYRIIDVVAASQQTMASGHYFVGTLSGASAVNVGQASSQFQFILRGTSPVFTNFGVVGSPTGTWTGSSFSGTTLTERNTATSNVFSSGSSAGAGGACTIIADKDFIIAHIKSSNSLGNSGMYFYVTIPKRIYSQIQDPNPLTIMVGANQMIITSPGIDSHSSSFAMVGADSTTRTMQLISRNLIGDGVQSLPWTVGPNLSVNLVIQPIINKVLFTEAIMSSISTAGQYSLARAKLTNVCFTSNSFPLYQVVGDTGEYIHIVNGVLWPWDGTILPYNLLPLGA